VRVTLNGRGGKVGSVLGPALEAAGHELVELIEAEAMVDFTAPEVVIEHVERALDAGVPCVVGTTAWDPASVDGPAREKGLAVLYAPNFAIGAVLMMQLAEQAARYLPRAEIVELHGEQKKDAPSGTAKATAERLGGRPPGSPPGRRGATADDPARRLHARGLRPRRAAGAGAPAHAAARSDRRPRGAP
jgi:4-hydroxy-tetrahydrodipicolinate reductase